MALEGGEGSELCPGNSLTLGKTRYPSYRRLGGPQGRSGQVRKISPPPGFDPRTVQPVASHYTNYATQPTICWRWMVIPKWQLIFLSFTVCDFIISVIVLYTVYYNMACNFVPKFYVPCPASAISYSYLLHTSCDEHNDKFSCA